MVALPSSRSSFIKKIASPGHSGTHNPQPVHFLKSITGISLRLANSLTDLKGQAEKQGSQGISSKHSIKA